MVAIRGSAGSVEPLKAFFRHAPLDDASYIIVRHMPKGSQCQVKALLDCYSVLQIEEAADGIAKQKLTNE
jgi:two-component system CheB/CheR fusion protein